MPFKILNRGTSKVSMFDLLYKSNAWIMGVMIMKVCHFTTVHPYTDTRIFIKECCSLAAAGYETHLAAVNAPDTLLNGVYLHGIKGTKGNRLMRMMQTSWRAYQTVRKIEADIYHFHDPELLPIGLLLRLSGKPVIYDCHEDVPKQIMEKHWIPRPLRRGVSWLFMKVEHLIAKRLSAVIAVHPAVEERMRKIGCLTINVNNYPLLKELHITIESEREKEKAVCYIGAISQARGINEMIEAISLTDVTLYIAGRFSPQHLRREIVLQAGWKQVKELGQIDRQEVKQVLAKAVAGLVIFQPVPHHLVSMPTKIFEYMSAGIPVIASNLPLLKAVIEEYECGICVNPEDPREIADAIIWMINNPLHAARMGENGRKAVEKQFNWEADMKKLLRLYTEIIDQEYSFRTNV